MEFRDDLIFQTTFYMQSLALNHKIYISGSRQFRHLHVINDPNCKGLDCNFEPYALEILPFPDYASFGMTNFPNFASANVDTSCHTTSANEYENNKLSLFPNPTSGLVFLFPLIEVSEISVYSIYGNTCLMKTILNKEETQLNLDHLSSGIYLVVVSSLDGHRRSNFKVVIQN